MSDSDPLYTPDDKNLVAPTSVRNNPWDVPNLDEYLFYCCPECELKTKEYEIFYNHAVIIHELAKQTLQPILDDTEMVTEDISDKDEHSDKKVFDDTKLMKAEVVLDRSVVDNFVQSLQKVNLESYLDEDNYDIDIKEENLEDSDYSADEMSSNNDPSEDPLGKAHDTASNNSKNQVQFRNCVVCPFYGPQKSNAVKFPKSREVCEKWCESLGLTSYRKSQYVCLAHFSKDDLYFMKNQNRIKPSAIPKRHQPNPILKEIPVKKAKVKEVPKPKEPKKPKLTNVKCEKCDRIFKNEDGLKYHNKVHHPIEPKKVITSCPICHKSFDMSYLSIHLKYYHKPEEIEAYSSTKVDIDKLDKDDKTITVNNGDVVKYDKLVIASGAVPKELPSSKGIGNAFVLRQPADANAVTPDQRPGDRACHTNRPAYLPPAWRVPSNSRARLRTGQSAGPRHRGWQHQARPDRQRGQGGGGRDHRDAGARHPHLRY